MQEILTDCRLHIICSINTQCSKKVAPGYFADFSETCWNFNTVLYICLTFPLTFMILQNKIWLKQQWTYRMEDLLLLKLPLNPNQPTNQPFTSIKGQRLYRKFFRKMLSIVYWLIYAVETRRSSNYDGPCIYYVYYQIWWELTYYIFLV